MVPTSWKKGNLSFLLILSNAIFLVIYYTQIEFPVCDEYQSLLYQLSGGDFSDAPGINFIFQGYIGYSQLYNFLFNIYDNINWVALFDLLLLVLGLGIYQYRIAKISKGFFNNYWWILLSVFVLTLFFLDGFAVISFSRAALIMCGVSLYSLLFTDYSEKQKWLYHLLFIAGMLLRPEAGIGMFLFVSIAFLIYRFDLFQLFKRVKIVGLIVFSFISVSWYLINYDDNFLYQIEPEIEYNFMQGNVLPLEEGASLEDSIKYALATNAFIFDPEVLSADYLRSIQFVPIEKDLINRFTLSFDKILEQTAFYSLSWILFFLLLFFSLFLKKWNLLFRVLALTALTLFLFAMLDMTSGIGERHIQPFLAIYHLILLHYFVYYFSKDELSYPLMWSSALLLLVFFSKVYVANVMQFSYTAVRSCKLSEGRNSSIDNYYQGELIVGTLSSVGDVFYKRYSVSNKSEFDNQFMLFAAYHFSMIPPYDSYIKRLLDRDKYNARDVYQYLSDHNAIYLAAEKDAQLAEDYLNIIYDMDIVFEPEEFQFEDSASSVLVYRLSSK